MQKFSILTSKDELFFEPSIYEFAFQISVLLLCKLQQSYILGYRTLADFLSADKKSSLVGQCAVNSDKSATKSRLVGRYLTVLDLKPSCWALLASVRWAKTICRGSRVPKPMRNYHESHVNKRFANMTEIYSAPSLNAVGRDKESASVRQADGPTNFSPIDPDKKSAVLRQKIGQCAAAYSSRSWECRKQKGSK